MGNAVEIIPGVYLGSKQWANDDDFLRSKKIQSVLTIMEKPLKIKKCKNHYFIPMYDNGISPNGFQFYEILDSTFQWIEEKRKEGNMLIHCRFGKNRSASIVISYIMWKYDLSFEDAKKLVSSRKKIILFKEMQQQIIYYFQK